MRDVVGDVRDVGVRVLLTADPMQDFTVSVGHLASGDSKKVSW